MSGLRVFVGGDQEDLAAAVGGVLIAAGFKVALVQRGREWSIQVETRESGDSVPERGGLLHPKSPGFSWPAGAEAPVLNKSGGSDVDGGDATCDHDWRPYFAHLVCVKCGAAQRGAAGG